MPGAIDGVSQLPMLEGAASSVRHDFLLEHVPDREARDPPSYCGVRTASQRVYVRYADGFEEFYNLRTDPWQLRNKISAPATTAKVQSLRTRADQLCSPTQPWFDPSAG